MKIGRNLPKLRRAVAAAGRTAEAWLVEHAAMPTQRVTRWRRPRRSRPISPSC
jgi:precorrin-2/cobalt-factor-2 C20-methyltransferase